VVEPFLGTERLANSMPATATAATMCALFAVARFRRFQRDMVYANERDER
jgi:hypothetical protein